MAINYAANHAEAERLLDRSSVRDLMNLAESVPSQIAAMQQDQMWMAWAIASYGDALHVWYRSKRLAKDISEGRVGVSYSGYGMELYLQDNSGRSRPLTRDDLLAYQDEHERQTCCSPQERLRLAAVSLMESEVQ